MARNVHTFFFLLVIVLLSSQSNGFSVSSSLKKTRSEKFYGRVPQNLSLSNLVSLRGGDMSEMLKDAWEWNANLGAPAALVAGAVIATFSDKKEDLTANEDDKRWVKRVKRLCRFFLLSSFVLEVICIFVTTVTGTMLMTHGDGLSVKALGTASKSPLGLMNHNFEFEYLTSRVTFIQGLFHWMMAVLLETIIPSESETKSAIFINQFFASIMGTLIVFMFGFYNSHMTFYKDFGAMILKYVGVVFKRYFWYWPWRPTSYLIVPAVALNFYMAKRAMDAIQEEN